MAEGDYEMRGVKVPPLERGEVRGTDTIHSTTYQPTPVSVSASLHSQSALQSRPRDTSALVFQPESPTTSTSTSSPPRSNEPLRIPLPPAFRPRVDTNDSSRTELSTPDSMASASGSGSAGSSSTSARHNITNHQMSRARSNTSHRTSSRPNTPTSATIEMNHLTRPTSRKGKEVMEFTVIPNEAAFMGKQRMETGDEQGEKTKEDMAMAKWRKWVIEQPIQVVSPQSTSPIRSRQGSPGPQNIPMVPLGPSTSPQDSLATTASPYDTFSPKHRSSSLTGAPMSPTQLTSPLISRYSRFGSADMDIQNTESVMALRDVELAVDPEVMERASRAKAMPRRMSTQPRISELPNPFVDISTRLGSRRVRPIVLELIQALGHYIDAVWCINYPSRPCPWIIGVDESPLAPSIRRMTMAYHPDNVENSMGWKSPMITAVQDGKKTGHVHTPPSKKDVEFWEQEVTFSIRDVDEIVGIYKGVGWAFAMALEQGDYGPVSDDNVLGGRGEGGGLARLLNDLEEAIWGDAPPRPTDLAYDLPIDFDPYAIPDDNDLMAAAAAGPRGRTPALSDFFNESSPSRGTPPSPVLEEEMANLPDLIDASNSDTGHTDGIASPDSSHSGAAKQRTGSYIPGLEEIEGAEEMTLEELGKKRHQEWLQSRRADVIAGGW
nr:uncharacterized protein CI109_007162 [Kwoniella shandongensis]KAA5524507.1 hypothetical protein CI109_007162 [Kwoniella shandongensis]